MKRLRVALIHDWLTGMRGGEKVLETLCSLFPTAEIYTLFHFKGSVSHIIERHTIRASFLQKFPFTKRHYRSYLPLFPLAIESFNLEGYDLIISTSHCVAKGIIPNPEAIHISYCFTPMRYIWDRRADYFGSAGRLKGSMIQAVLHYLRQWDTASVGRTHQFVAISQFVRNRIQTYYGRESQVIYPPVDCQRFHLSDKKGDYFLLISAFAPYKRIDQAILAFNRLGHRLVIVGSGQEEKKLKKIAKKNIEFLGWSDDTTLRNLYAGCRALIFPGVEDFGLVPVEAQASGRPVIAYGRGGVLESVIPYVSSDQPGTGIFYEVQSPSAIVNAVKAFEKIEDHFDPDWIRKNAMRFDRERFLEAFNTLANDAVQQRG